MNQNTAESHVLLKKIKTTNIICGIKKSMVFTNIPTIPPTFPKTLCLRISLCFPKLSLFELSHVTSSR